MKQTNEKRSNMSEFTVKSVGFLILIIMVFFMYKKSKNDDKKDNATFEEIKAKYPNVSIAHIENTNKYNILWMLFKRGNVEMLEACPCIGMFWYSGYAHDHHEVGGASLEEIMSKRPRMPLQHLIINGRSTEFQVVSPEPYIIVDAKHETN